MLSSSGSANSFIIHGFQTLEQTQAYTEEEMREFEEHLIRQEQDLIQKTAELQKQRDELEKQQEQLNAQKKELQEVIQTSSPFHSNINVQIRPLIQTLIQSVVHGFSVNNMAATFSVVIYLFLCLFLTSQHLLTNKWEELWADGYIYTYLNWILNILKQS